MWINKNPYISILKRENISRCFLTNQLTRDMRMEFCHFLCLWLVIFRWKPFIWCVYISRQINILDEWARTRLAQLIIPIVIVRWFFGLDGNRYLVCLEAFYLILSRSVFHYPSHFNIFSYGFRLTLIWFSND